ncbi:MAG: ParB/RepB/Spo0J family partition protein [Candidatus Marinimicrobia bacterium]|nr:ParB/RepB/Spo0J family partition protein [Candidatus Neomarinimicrobiota bacterium]
MQVTFKPMGLIGPTIHSDFKALPFRWEAFDPGQPLQKPLLALNTGKCIKIVGGIQRFEAAREADVTHLPAYLLENVDSSMDLLKLVAAYYSPLTLIDRANLIGIARKLGFSKTQIAEGLFEPLDIPPQAHLMNDYLFLLKLPQELQQMVVDKDLSLKRALIFQRAEEHLNWVVQLIQNLHLGINMTAEIIQNIWEMAQRDETDFKTKAQQMGLWDIAREAIDDPRPVVMEIRSKIAAARLPHLTAAEKRLKQTIQAANLPDNVKVKWDPYFEKQGVELSFHAKDLTEFQEILRGLKNANLKPVFDQI